MKEASVFAVKAALLFDHFGPYHQARLRAAAEGMEVVGVEFHPRSRDYAWEPARLGVLPLVSVPPTKSEGPEAAREFQGVLEKTLEEIQPEVVAIPGWASREALVALSWCLRQGVPTILMSESCAHDEVRVGWKEWVKRRIIDCHSAALAGGTLHARYLKLLGMGEDQISLGYDAVDNAWFAEQGPRLRRSLDSSQEPCFLASARFIPKKNISRLLTAYAAYRQVCGDAKPWRLVLLGDGELRGEVEKQVHELGLRPFVSMPGFLQYEELPCYYARASAFIHASTTEQWGLVVNEAMASGLPVLVSNRCGCAEDLVEEGINGFTFDPEDVQGMTAVMGRMAALPEDKLRQMGRESERIIADWGPARFAEGMRQAAITALKTGAKKPSLVDRVLLKILMSR
ncbi:glycosyltransferase family 4 protein [Prosthecobacter algae]|uniref:Glycosyltransferase family 4 protein n=1 Tax=Prosthecobacter algae TaxID=1144682 RepID=A0ABP9NT48_9BACT